MKNMKTKVMAFFATLLAMFAGLTANVFASTTPPTIDIADSIGSGMTSMVGEIMGVLAVVVPIALGLVGIVIAIRKGISLMRSMVS